jgi:hypothetical protein
MLPKVAVSPAERVVPEVDRGDPREAERPHESGEARRGEFLWTLGGEPRWPQAAGRTATLPIVMAVSTTIGCACCARHRLTAR